jgi:hypothetical protein
MGGFVRQEAERSTMAAGLPLTFRFFLCFQTEVALRKLSTKSSTPV